MKKWLGGFCGICMMACMQEDPEIGSDFFGDVSFEIISWDTLSFELYTVALDSLPTNTGSRVLVGQVDHSDLDSIVAQSYFQFSPSEGYFFDGENIEFVDAYLTLNYDGYFYGDTLSAMNLELFELSEEMVVDDDGLLYKDDSFTTKPNAIGEFTFSPRPFSLDSIEIPIDGTFATNLFEFLNKEQVSEEDFIDAFYGLKICSESSNAILGFHSTPTIKINYLDNFYSPPVERTLTIESSDEHIKFNQITSELAAYLFEDMEEKILNSSDLDHKSYVQSGSGLATRLEFPYLKQLLNTEDAPVIEEVLLELVFENKVPEEVAMLSESLILSKVDRNNNLILNYSAVPELVVDLEFNEERKLVIDIKEFVEDQLLVDTQEANEALLLRFSTDIYQSSVDHLIISDHIGNSSSKIILNELKIK
ncbi:MAG: DUF4270 family protein [Reichenbachiella sp.]|uniref:DUF4270 family protein n=1 Tax=Reichenbachiella sp. TaxID=2184521 RepID=UPI00329A28AC